MRLCDIYRYARERPAHIAVVDSGVEVTYSSFARTIEAIRKHLAKNYPVVEGVVAITSTITLMQTWALQLALRSLGWTTVTAANLDVLNRLQLSELVAIVAFDNALEGGEPDETQYRGLRKLIVPAQLLRAAQSVVLPHLPEEPLKGDHIVFTSGTTGRYKKLLFTSEAFVSRKSEDDELGLSYDSNDIVHLMYFGEWTSVGNLNPQRAWAAGATVIFDQRADAIRRFFDYQVTSTVLMGQMISDLLDQNVDQPAGYPHVTIRISGGFYSTGLIERLKQSWGCSIVNMYGATEFATALMSVVEREDDQIWLSPTRGNALEIVDDDGRAVADDVPGTVRVRLGPWYPDRYYEDAQATEQFYRNGYFYPGDIAVRRADGRIRILGRTKDVLVIAGAKVPVAPHEEKVRNILGIDEVCLFARQEDSGKVVLIVVVEGVALPSRDRLEIIAKGYAATFSGVRFISVPVFPRGENGMGKVDRRAVLKMARI